MRTIRPTAIAALCVLIPMTTLADGLVYQLPEDGAWVRFDIAANGSAPDGAPYTIAGTTTISSVGSVEVKGRRCRWIEIATQASRNDEPFTIIHKVLIPERHLAEGKEPLKHILQAWHKNSMIADGQPRQIDLAGLDGACYLPLLYPSLHGPFQLPKKLETAPIDSKLGKLECEGIVATDKTRHGGGVNEDVTYTIRLHRKAPFGVVTWQSETKIERNGQSLGTQTMTMKLADFGKGAKTAIPDSI